ncbi:MULTISPECIES: NUDIX hydrolase [Chitinophaga]|uniref:NUDIX hydrolase n=1 Tax=Chitinophaga TaxID=79328 RepID=UPI001CEDCCA3|nr:MULTISPECIES: NUDIX hydrolase [Chitinophaga]
MSLEWKVLSSTYLHRDTWLTARQDSCVMPSGKLVEKYYVLEYANWVNGVAITEEGKIILIRQYRHGTGKVLLEIPAGAMDPTDPSPEFAMRRELLEETGYDFADITLLGTICPNPASSNNYAHMFLATGGKKVQEQDLDDTEEIEILLMDREEVMTLLRNKEIMQSLHISCLFYAFLHLGWLQ